jgi:peptidoglycan/LPS O-acetylase OafA/YrhL
MGPYQFGLEWGLMGVNLFFVLSGFLITGILLDGRAGATGRGERWFVIRQFYTRRVLRIFPLFYLTLALLALANVRTVRHDFFWHFCYLSNVYFFRCGAWQWAWSNLSHFWSLAVEEQFYLVWPYLVIFLPVRLLRPVLWGLIGLAPVYRVVMGIVFPQNQLPFVLTVGCLDALGIGALLAFAQRSTGNSLAVKRRLERGLLWTGLAAWLAFKVMESCAIVPKPLLYLQQTFVDMIFGWVIVNAARGFSGWFGRLLQWSPIAYLGKISYGLYVFHNLAVYGVVFGVWYLHFPEMCLKAEWLLRLELPILTIAAAALSWHFFEKPLNDLKRYFPYNASTRPQ